MVTGTAMLSMIRAPAVLSFLMQSSKEEYTNSTIATIAQGTKSTFLFDWDEWVWEVIATCDKLW